MASSELVIKNRFLGFLIWQSIPSTAIFAISKTLIFPSSLALTLVAFVTFHFSHLLFSSALAAVASPRVLSAAGPIELAAGVLRALLLSGAASPEFRCRVRVSLVFFVYTAASAIAGSVAALSLCFVGSSFDEDDGLGWRLGFKGFCVGLLYGLHYVYKRRWVLEFPIIQRPPFFSFKMGIPPAITRALRLSGIAHLTSTALILLLPHQLTSYGTLGRFISEMIRFYLGCFAFFLSWELSHHLHRVLHMKRFVLAPPKGSAAAETNPSEPLLAALEESQPNSLLQFLAYLDLCMVCENNVDIWRRAAFFEESGETYKRVIAVGLRPLEQLASKLGECLENSSDKSSQLSSQLRLPADIQPDPSCSELLNNFQLYTWCARIIASLTARSHHEDRYGVAQLSGSNTAVISTLISALLAIESLMGKTFNVQSPNSPMGPSGIKWATSSMRRPDVVGPRKKRGSLVNSQAYAIADVLKISIYQIVSAFHDEMVASAKAGLVEKDWIMTNKPLFGTRDLLQQKLRLFLDFRAT